METLHSAFSFQIYKSFDKHDPVKSLRHFWFVIFKKYSKIPFYLIFVFLCCFSHQVRGDQFKGDGSLSGLAYEETVSTVTMTFKAYNGATQKPTVATGLGNAGSTSGNIFGAMNFQTKATFTFSVPINITTIVALKAGYILVPEEFTFTNTTSDNSDSPVTHLVPHNDEAPTDDVVTLNWTAVSSFEVTFPDGAVDGIIFDNLSFVPASVITTAASSINTISAVLGGNVLDTGGPAISDRGIVYSSIDNTPTDGEDNVTKDPNGSGFGIFSEPISGLTPGTTYYFQAYAYNGTETKYGGVESFTTHEAPTVTTQAVSSIATTTATGNGNITDLGIPNPTAHGVCWSTSENPTTGDSFKDVGAASATGTFTASITGLTAGTTYYLRAYATNDLGTGYGAQVSFTTNSAPTLSINTVTLDYTEDPDFLQINADPTQIDPAATLSDVDGDADWDGGKLEVQITSNNESADEISIPDNKVGTINTSGSDIKNGSTIIGTLSHSEGKVTNDTKLIITFNANATNALAQDVLRAIHYRSTSDEPGTLNRTITFTAIDKNTLSTSDSRTISVTAKDDAPTFSATRLDPTFTEDGTAAVLFSSTSASTNESGQNLTGFKILVSNVNDGVSEIINVDGVAIALINSASGNTGKYNYSVSLSGTQATITFTGGAVSTSAFETVIDEISYQNNSNTPNTDVRPLSVTDLTDSGLNTDGNVNYNEFDAVDCTVTVLAANDAPSISINSSTLAYTEDDAAKQIDAAATLSDPEGDGEWNSGTLEIQIIANAEGADEISIADNVVGSINTSGTNILNDVTVIGTLSASEGTVTSDTKLTITFNADVTNALVQDVLRAIHYRNTSDNPGTSNRTVTITATDQNAAIASDTRTISVASADNDAPTVPTNNTLSINEAASATISSVSHLSATDADDDDATLVFTMTTNASNGALKKSGSTLEQDGTFTQADLTDGNMTYVHDGTNTGSDSFIFKVSDDNSNELTNQTFSIDVTTRTQFALLDLPASSSTDNSALNIDFSLPEAASPGTLKMTFTRTGGTADGYAPHVITFATGFETAVRHTTTLDGTDLSSDANVESVNTDGNDALVDGAIYSVKLAYQDVLLNTAAPTMSTSFTYDNISELPTLASPATSTSDNASLEIDFTLPEAARSGTAKMTFTRTGGTADANSPHVLTFAAGFESAAQHMTTLDGTDLSSNANVTSVSSGVNDALVNGAIYSVKLEYEDTHWNSASFVNHTGFTYDLATQLPTLNTPAAGSSDNASLAIDFSLPEAAKPGTVEMTFTRTGGNTDANGPHIITFKSGFESAGQHTTVLDGANLSIDDNVLSVSTDGNDFLVNGAIYSVKLAYQDAVGNSETSSTNTVFTYDLNYAPSVTTQAVSSILTTTATGNGTVTDLGFPNPSQHGVCWSTSENPTITDDHTSKGEASSTGAFTSDFTGLIPGTTYHLRAYATNLSGTSYGDDVIFTADKVPSVTTQAVSSISTTTAIGNGNITYFGVPNPTQHGVCWNTGGSPTVSDSKTSEGAASATGAFTSGISGLTDGITYHVRAYATNEAGTSYGSSVSFTTQTTPTVQATNVEFTEITSSQMDASWTRGNGSNCIAFMKETSDGSSSPSDNTSFDANSVFGNGSQIGSTGWYCVYKGTDNKVTVTGLSRGTTYLVFVCEYNGLAGSELYNTTTSANNPGNEMTLMTPELTTQAVSNITSTTATGNGNITDLGLPNPTQHGVCWSTSENPTTGDSKDEKGAVSVTGAFTSSISSLSSNTTYYVRAFVTNSAGTVYGEQMIFSTLIANDYTPVITANQSFDVDENAADNVSVGIVLAEDSDAVTSFTSWTITAGNEEGVFAIDATTGAITVDNNTKLDYETTTSYTLSIMVSDGRNTSAAEDVTININPINDNTPVITASQSFYLNEDAVNTASVGTVSVNDADAGTTYSNWTISSGNDDAIFAINPTSGVITVEDNSSLDYETITNYTLLVTVSDGTNISAPQNIFIDVMNLNDNTPSITANQTFTIHENLHNGNSFATILANDNDHDSVLNNWKIVSGNESNAFSLNNTNGHLIVNNSSLLDREKTEYFRLTLSVSDGIHVSIPEVITIYLDDLNDNLPIVTPNQNFTIDENSNVNASIGNVLASDADITKTKYNNWTITNMVDFNQNGNHAVAIDPNSGELTVNDPEDFDCESNFSFNINIKVADGTGFSAEELVTINLKDVNEFVPVITSEQTFNLKEDAEENTIIGKLKATDSDLNHVFGDWQITKGNEDALFEIGASNGEITLADNAKLDYEIANTYTLSVSVSDGEKLSSEATIIIEIDNVNERPIANAGDNRIVAENSMVILNGLGSEDPDGDELNYLWSSPEGIELSDFFDAKPTFETPNVNVLTDYVFTLIVNDGELYSKEVSVTISVDNVTGIEDFDLENFEVSTYPNPSKGAFYLELNKRPKDNASVSIMSSSGKLVYSKKVYEKKNYLNLSLKAGMYILSVRLDNEILTKKIVVR